MFSNTFDMVPAGRPGGALTVNTPTALSLPGPIREALQSEFPALDELGPIAGPFCHDLCARHRLPPEVPALAALVTVSGLAGQPGRVWTGLETVPIGLFLILGATPGCGAKAAITELMDSVHDHQADRVCFAGKYNRDDLLADDKCLRARVHHGTMASDSPEKKKGISALNAIHHALHPFVLVESLERQALLQMMEHSLDGRLLHFSAYEGFTAALTQAGSDVDLALIAKCLNQLPIQVTEKNRPPMHFHAPGLSAILLTTPDELRGFLAHYDRLPVTMWDAVIALDADVRPSRASFSDFLPLESSVAWGSFVNGFARRRLVGPSEILFGISEACKEVWGFHDEIVDLLPAAPPELHAFLTALPRLAWRLSAAVHLLQPDGGFYVSAASAQTGVKLARFYGGRQLTDWLSARHQIKAEQSNLEIEAVFARIRLRGPISRRDLYRSFKHQRAALYEPVIHRLLKQGEIVQDERGYLLAPPAN